MKYSLAQDAVNIVGCGSAVKNRYRVIDLACHANKVHEIAVAQGVVHTSVLLLRGSAWGAHDMDNRHVFCIRASGGVDCRELTHAVGGADGGDAAYARVTISGVTGVEFVSVTYPLEVFVGEDVVEKVQVEVARYAENFGSTEFYKAIKKIIANVVSHNVLCLSSPGPPGQFAYFCA